MDFDISTDRQEPERRIQTLTVSNVRRAELQVDLVNSRGAIHGNTTNTHHRQRTLFRLH
jgi:hypothetical protein